MWRSTWLGSRCSRAASSARSAEVNRIFWPCSCRSRMLSWCRRARISASLARPVTHRQQSQHRKRVGHAEVRQSQ